MGLFGFLWDLHQQSRISDLERRVDHQTISAARQTSDDDLSRLQRQIDSLQLVNAAMWSILCERLGCTDQQLQDRVQAIDLADGELDGRIAQPRTVCTGCGRPISRRHDRCIYCGTPSP